MRSMRSIAVDGVPRGSQGTPLFGAKAGPRRHSDWRSGPHAQVAPVELRALERVHGGGGGLGVAVLDDGRARGPLGPAAREDAEATSPDDSPVRALFGRDEIQFMTKMRCVTLSATLRRVFAGTSFNLARPRGPRSSGTDADATVEVEAVALRDGVPVDQYGGRSRRPSRSRLHHTRPRLANSHETPGAARRV